jgi:hypothetical protein
MGRRPCSREGGDAELGSVRAQVRQGADLIGLEPAAPGPRVSEEALALAT